MKSNYFIIHKNKKPKKAKYSKPYTRLEIEKMQACTEYFLNEIQKIKLGTANFLAPHPY